MAARLALVAAFLISLLLPAQAHHIASHPVDEPDAGSLEPSLATTGADLALVLAVDVSPPMDVEELTLERQGFIEAFRSPEVHEAVRKGSAGRIAVMYVERAGSSQQQVVIPWTVIEHPADGRAFAARLAGSSMHQGKHTSISAAIDFGVQQLREGAVRATRRAIDISGDGANNQGRMVTLARNEALAHDVTINGLPIVLKRPAGTWETAELDLYFRDCVIGGSGAFMIPVREPSQFAEATRLKIVREIADRPQARALVQRAGGERPRCFHDPCSEEGSVC
ncbi:DUF1194 domain-containing protein [Microvirga yunnanensis]|uniref:DUF1194 domain-containing protein n=1 Tax=Microvirga yunnanensis TaxID=2953740 RepID=UPI0021C7CDB1|nr:DUF1194 domain-containing protein [Microvirga sp. HBU65207]